MARTVTGDHDTDSGGRGPGSRDNIQTLASTLRGIKGAMACSGAPKPQIAEAIPAEPSHEFPVPHGHLDMLHSFAAMNPIYRGSRELILAGTRCVMYEGDANRYWLRSTLHAASRAPFSPTWIASAYVVARLVQEAGYSHTIDVGAGDGRVAFCSSMVGMTSYSIEIDRELADLQQIFVPLSEFQPFCSNASEFDYARIGPGDGGRVAVFVGGLAQMGGDALADGVMMRLRSGACKDAFPGEVGWVFAGTKSPKYPHDPSGQHGWGGTMKKWGLNHVRTVELPTAWTLDQPSDTPYVIASGRTEGLNGAHA